MGPLRHALPKSPRPQTLAGALCYCAAAAFALCLARADGGVAMVWVASAVLAAWLAVTDRREWPLALALAAIGNEVLSGWLGLGWVPGLGLTAANLGEAVAAAALARASVLPRWPEAGFERAAAFMIGITLVIPALSATWAAAVATAFAGAPFAHTWQSWVLGHAVGFIAVMPFALTLATRWPLRPMRRRSDRAGAVPGPQRLISVLMLATMAVLDFCVFLQAIRWPLVAPLLFALFAAVWADALIATAMPLLIALIGAPLTLAGLGPIAPGLTLVGDRLQLGLLYAGLVAFAGLPVVFEQARRRAEIARLSRSAAHYQAMSQRADDLIDELRRAALTDPLTGLPNRRAFFDALGTQAASGEVACIAMIDIDHFKKVNDRLGHAAGDHVLRHFAELARSTFRSSDCVARIGGEEFAVLLRAVELEQACTICQRLVDRLAASEIQTAAGAVCVTISSGLAPVGRDGEASLAAADRALYQAKRDGRSRLTAVA